MGFADTLKSKVLEGFGKNMHSKLLQPGSITKIEAMICAKLPDKENYCAVLVPDKKTGKISIFYGQFKITAETNLLVTVEE
jgi:hypothetical protein